MLHHKGIRSERKQIPKYSCWQAEARLASCGFTACLFLLMSGRGSETKTLQKMTQAKSGKAACQKISKKNSPQGQGQPLASTDILGSLKYFRWGPGSTNVEEGLPAWVGPVGGACQATPISLHYSLSGWSQSSSPD